MCIRDRYKEDDEQMCEGLRTHALSGLSATIDQSLVFSSASQTAEQTFELSRVEKGIEVGGHHCGAAAGEGKAEFLLPVGYPPEFHRIAGGEVEDEVEVAQRAQAARQLEISGSGAPIVLREGTVKVLPHVEKYGEIARLVAPKGIVDAVLEIEFRSHLVQYLLRYARCLGPQADGDHFDVATEGVTQYRPRHR